MIHRIFPSALLAFGLLHAGVGQADGPKDNNPIEVRRIPKPGVPVPDAVRQSLEKGIQALGNRIDGLRTSLKKKPELEALLPDVEIFHRAVWSALEYDEFFNANEFKVAESLLQMGEERAAELERGESSWTRQTGLVVRGFRSRLDGSVQPYGLVVPEGWSGTRSHPHRLDLWFHGRGETLSELSFLWQRVRQVGQFAPDNTFVLHPYGRYSNAFKFAGEIDVLEALDHAKAAYPIDEDRIAVRGFSMGGAGCWQFAVHYSDRFFAASPGAGFSETAQFLKLFQEEDVQPTDYERTLWHLYDCPDYAANLFHLPTIAYSGEEDRQKQAADVMEAALRKNDIELVHLIGPKMGHKYDEASKLEVERRLASLARRGRERVPSRIQFVTWTLRYPTMHWVQLDGMEEHWKEARVDARIESDQTIRITTRNATALTLHMEPGDCPLDMTRKPVVEIDGRKLVARKVGSDRSWTTHLVKGESGWQVSNQRGLEGLRKRPGLQGPVDDAFMDAFVFVTPSGKDAHPAVEDWTRQEMEHARVHWRQQFRGEARVVADQSLSAEQIASMNLVLWGTPESNTVLARLADQLPVRWKGNQVMVHGKAYDRAHHIPILIFPNPLNPERYVVLNSGFTYREYAYLNNARQVPKLPDWAVVDVRTPANPLWPGKIADAGFFTDQWTWPAK